jgi:hypothetical protein
MSSSYLFFLSSLSQFYNRNGVKKGENKTSLLFFYQKAPTNKHLFRRVFTLMGIGHVPKGKSRANPKIDIPIKDAVRFSNPESLVEVGH